MGAGEVVGGVFLRLGFCGGVFVTRVGGCRLLLLLLLRMGCVLAYLLLLLEEVVGRC